MKTRLVPFVLLAALCLVTAVHAAPSKGGPRFLGSKPPEKVKRVVTLVPSLTETVLALGAGSTLVGVSRFDESKEVAGLPRVGGFVNPSIERVMALEPDSRSSSPVLKPARRGDDGRLRCARAAAAAPYRRGYAGGVACGGQGSWQAEGGRGPRPAYRVHPGRIRERVKGVQAPRVLFVYGFQPLVVAGPGSFADELLRDAGAINVAGGAGSAYAVYSL